MIIFHIIKWNFEKKQVMETVFNRVLEESLSNGER